MVNELNWWCNIWCGSGAPDWSARWLIAPIWPISIFIYRYIDVFVCHPHFLQRAKHFSVGRIRIQTPSIFQIDSIHAWLTVFRRKMGGGRGRSNLSFTRNENVIKNSESRICETKTDFRMRSSKIQRKAHDILIILRLSRFCRGSITTVYAKNHLQLCLYSYTHK